MITEEGYDLVSGYKEKRYDPLSKTIPTKLFNATARKISGVKNLHDFNCGLKAYRSQVVKSIEVYGEMHRYIPFIAQREGFPRIGEKVVKHHPRRFGRTKFGLDRFINGFLDLLTITFVYRFGRKPMHFFGALGTLMFVLGAGASAWLVGEKLYHTWNHQLAPRVGDQALFFVALTAMIIGVQLFLAGFIGTLIYRYSSDRDNYRVVERVGG